MPMTSSRRHALRAGGALALAVLAAAVPFTVRAQAYPAKPIRVIVPYAAGSGTDLIARQVMGNVAMNIGQPVIFDNVVGAVGIIGTEALVRAPADGYTLEVTSSIHAILPSLYKLTFDPVKSVTPIAMLGTSPMVLVVSPKVPATTTRELIALAKAKPGTITIGSTGIGSVGHIAAELLQTSAGVSFLHVPYKSNAGFSTDLVGGQIDAGFLAGGAAVELVRAGRLRAIAVSTLTRSPALPDVPTLDESGVPGYEVAFWAALLAPAGTPTAVVARLSAEVDRAMAQKSVQDYMKDQSVSPDPSTPAATTEIIRRDVAKYDKVVKDANVKVD
jgi:tripartite-type tricarboxylate transporter receptor subunit TctC